MLFSSKAKILFVHIPKNAGNSIRPLSRKEGIKVITHNIRRKNKRLLASYRGKRNIHAFCISRNPYDRVVSAYTYLNSKTEHKEDLADREKYISPYSDFQDFIRNGLEKAAAEQMHFLPQVFWIKNKDNKPEIDSILRMENLQEDFNAFCKKMNLRQYDLKTTNVSKHRSWNEYYTKETKNMIRRIYHEDFQFFDYQP